MHNRRDFLRGVTAAAGWISTARAQESPRPVRRREVTVGGRRVRTIDVHAHCAVPEAMALMGLRPTNPLDVVGPQRLQQMDEEGIDVEALSINPYWYLADRELAQRIVKIQNENLARLCADHPDRFVAFATVALQFPETAAAQLEEAVQRLRLRGAFISATVNGEELSAPRFDPFWKKAEQLGVLIFIHPQGMPELERRLQGNGYLTNVIAFPLETTIALSHFIFEGTLDRFPGLKICAAHGGGFLASYSARSDRACQVFHTTCQSRPKKRPTEYLRQLYFDSIVFTSEGLRHLVAECGAGHILLGTDTPAGWTSTAVDHILETPSLSDDERAALLGGSAARLLGIAS